MKVREILYEGPAGYLGASVSVGRSETPSAGDHYRLYCIRVPLVFTLLVRVCVRACVCV